MKQTEFRDEDQIKVKLFDRIFKPQIITLENGNTVERPRSRMPLILIVRIVHPAFRNLSALPVMIRMNHDSISFLKGKNV